MTKITAWLTAAAALLAIPFAVATADVQSDAFAKDFTIKNSALYQRLRGQIILRVQGSGEAYYVSPVSTKLIYLGHGRKALDSLLYQSTGISNATIRGVLPGIMKATGVDSDMDGLNDNLERAIGTNPLDFNSDQDRYSDSTEVGNGFDPLGFGAWPISAQSTEKLKGRILLQVESRGQSWYVNPKNGMRYLFSNQYDTAEMIRTVGTGITNYNFNLLVK